MHQDRLHGINVTYIIIMFFNISTSNLILINYFFQDLGLDTQAYFFYRLLPKYRGQKTEDLEFGMGNAEC